MKKLKDLIVQPHSVYRVKVSFFDGNPPFWAILLTGFINDNGTPGSYSKIVGTDIDECEILDGEWEEITVSAWELIYAGKDNEQ